MIENFKVGMMDVMGFGYEVLSVCDLWFVMGSVIVFGLCGLLCDWLGFD